MVVVGVCFSYQCMKRFCIKGALIYIYIYKKKKSDCNCFDTKLVAEPSFFSAWKKKEEGCVFKKIKEIQELCYILINLILLYKKK